MTSARGRPNGPLAPAPPDRAPSPAALSELSDIWVNNWGARACEACSGPGRFPISEAMDLSVNHCTSWHGMAAPCASPVKRAPGIPPGWRCRDRGEWRSSSTRSVRLPCACRPSLAWERSHQPTNSHQLVFGTSRCAQSLGHIPLWISQRRLTAVGSPSLVDLPPKPR
jgi:hypothetical protein